MRLLIITKYVLPPHPDGKTRGLQMEKLVTALADSGCQISLVAGIPQGATPCFSAPPSVAVTYVPFNVQRVQLLKRRIHVMLFGSAWPTWVRKAGAAALDAAKTFNPTVLFSSSTPIDSHLAALRVLKRRRLPWACSFSDPWPAEILPPPYCPANPTFVTARGAAVDMGYARRTLRRASGLHLFSRHGLDLLEEKAGVPLKDKACIIPHIGSNILANGSADQFPGSGDRARGKWLAHFGALNHWRFSPPLFEAAAEVASAHTDKFKGLLCIGDTPSDFKELVAQRGWANWVEFMPWMIQPVLPAALARKIGCFLMIEADMPESPFIPSKFADYACSRAPILAVTPEVSTARDYLRDHASSGVAAGHNRREIADAIKGIFGIEGSPSYKHDASLADNFSPGNVASEYMRMFEAVCQRAGNR